MLVEKSYWDYDELISDWGFLTVSSISIGSYQGDSVYILKDNNQFGVLIFGWGSCSGCDALQNCSNFSEVRELQQQLKDSIKWFMLENDLLTYLVTHDWRGDYIWCPELIDFICDNVKSFLKAREE